VAEKSTQNLCGFAERLQIEEKREKNMNQNTTEWSGHSFCFGLAGEWWNGQDRNAVTDQSTSDSLESKEISLKRKNI